MKVFFFQRNIQCVGFFPLKWNPQLKGYSSSMPENLNVFQGLINETVSLDIPLADEVLALLLPRSLPDSWETLVVTLGNSPPQGKLTLDTLKSSLLNEETQWKERDSSFEHKALVTKTPQIEEETILGFPRIIEITLRGGLNPEIKKIFPIIIVVVQIIVKQIVEIRGDTKRMKPLTIRKMTL